MTASDHGRWPRFETLPIDREEALAQLHEWLGEAVRVEVEHGGEAGYSSFHARLSMIEPGACDGQHLLRFEEDAALVSLDATVLSFSRITGTTGRTGWVEFKAGPRRVLEIGLEDPDEVWWHAERSRLFP